MITKYFLKQTFDGNVQSIPDTNGTKNLQDTQLPTFFFSLSSVCPSFGGLHHWGFRNQRAPGKTIWRKRVWQLALVVSLFRIKKDPFKEEGLKGCTCTVHCDMQPVRDRKRQRERWNEKGSSQGFERCPLWLWCKFSKRETGGRESGTCIIRFIDHFYQLGSLPQEGGINIFVQFNFHNDKKFCIWANYLSPCLDFKAVLGFWTEKGSSKVHWE